MNIKQHYCEVNQYQANEARELLVKAGEPIWDDEFAFEVIPDVDFILKYSKNFKWFVYQLRGVDRNSTQLTYAQFKEMLNEKIKESCTHI